MKTMSNLFLLKNEKANFRLSGKRNIGFHPSRIIARPSWISAKTWVLTRILVSIRHGFQLKRTFLKQI